jgi:hypothetical protein
MQACKAVNIRIFRGKMLMLQENSQSIFLKCKSGYLGYIKLKFWTILKNKVQ